MQKEDILKKLAENIRVERTRKRYSQDKLAELAGISQNYLANIETEKSNPSIVVLINICEALKVDLNTIFKL